MGMAMSCAASAASALGTWCACTAVTAAATSLARNARAAYCAMFVVSMLASWLLRDYARPMMEKIPWVVPPHEGGASTGWCGTQAVLRLSLGQTAFFAILAAATAGVKDKRSPRAAVHEGWWAVKFLVWVACVALPFFLPNSGAVHVFGEAARVGAGMFLFVQVLILLDFVHAWNDAWVAKDDDKWYGALLAVSLVCYAGTAGICAVSYWYYAGCAINTFFVTLTLALAFFMTVAALHPACANGSLLASAVVSLYCAYLNLGAMMSEPAECNPLKHVGASQGSLAAGLVVTFLAVMYSAFKAGSSDVFSISGGSSAAAAAAGGEDGYIRLKEAEEGAEGAEGKGDGGEDEAPEQEPAPERESEPNEPAPQPVEYSYSFFHLIFAAATMYCAMLMTDWGELDTTTVQRDTINTGWPSVWVKIISEWATAGIFFWSLVAPSVFPDRDFS